MLLQLQEALLAAPIPGGRSGLNARHSSTPLPPLHSPSCPPQVLLQLQEALLAAPIPGGRSGDASSSDQGAVGDGGAEEDAPGGSLPLPPLSDRQRALACEALAAADKDLVDGADDFLQLLNVAAQMQKALTA